MAFMNLNEENPMQVEQINIQLAEKPGIYGVQDMVELVESSPLHSLKKGEIQDYGELCDQDCLDCD